jgi:hypothetical protein
VQSNAWFLLVSRQGMRLICGFGSLDHFWRTKKVGKRCYLIREGSESVFDRFTAWLRIFWKQHQLARLARTR